MRSALTIAGSDSGGGAGIQADLKSFAGVGVHGCSVLTCITAQNTKGVNSIYPIPIREIEKQIEAVLFDFDIMATKTGMLYSPDIVKTVAKKLRNQEHPVLVDPVMVATVGDSLQRKDFKDSLVRHLLPLATIVTPNLYEATHLTGIDVETVEDMRKAAKTIHDMGVGAVLMKGGHLSGKLVDLLYDGRSFHEFVGFRFPRELHGSGCTLAASIVGYLAIGLPLKKAIISAEGRVAAGFQTSYMAGKGVPIINSHYRVNRYEIWREVTLSGAELTGLVPIHFVPEVGMNIGYALEGAKSLEDVCALRGRIHLVGDTLKVAGHADFGASKHIGRIILAAMSFNPTVRSVVNLKYKDQNLHQVRRARLRIGTFNRAEQPRGTSTMEWGTTRAIQELGSVPDVIYDVGGIGKEPMIRVLGRNPKDVLRKIRKITKGDR